MTFYNIKQQEQQKQPIKNINNKQNFKQCKKPYNSMIEDQILFLIQSFCNYFCHKDNFANFPLQKIKKYILSMPFRTFVLQYKFIYAYQNILQSLMDYRTPKCTHNERGRCIHCLTKQIKQEKKTKEEGKQNQTKCFHAPNMKCLKCMEKPTTRSQKCTHHDYQKCPNCENYKNVQDFKYYLKQLEQNCSHKKPCTKCVPPQSRTTYFIDKNCTFHAPYPQAQCDHCMAPTITIQKQKYSHVKKVIIKTIEVNRIIDAQCFGILLGTQKQGIVCVQDIYFPKHQIKNVSYFDPEQVIGQFSYIFQKLGLKQVGIIYSSPQITAEGLIISSMFQQKCAEIQYGHQVSKFITMRLHYNQLDGAPFFECFMVSDQFQTFYKNKLTYLNSKNKSCFDLITASGEKLSELPTFLRQGVETQQYFFKEIITWIETVPQQSYFLMDINLQYPFYTLQKQSLDNIDIFMSIQTEDPWIKYRNIQFLLHLSEILTKDEIIIFLNDFIHDPDFYLSEKLKEYRKKQQEKLVMKSGMSSRYRS